MTTRRLLWIPRAVGILLTLSGAANAQFTPAAGSPFSVAVSDPSSVAVGDFNRDGKLDLAVANWDMKTVTVLLGDGTGGFKQNHLLGGFGLQFPAGTYPYSVVVGDFNGDGLLDLAVANGGDNTVTILEGNGGGGFTAAPGSPFNVGSVPYSLAVGYFQTGSGNFIADVAIGNEGSNNVSMLYGYMSPGYIGSGQLGPLGPPFLTGTRPVSVVAADFNLDGYPDLAVANYGSNSIWVLQGNGEGGFNVQAPIGHLGTPAYGLTGPPTKLAVGDFNGDGRPDLAVLIGNTLTVLLNTKEDTLFTFAPAAGSPITVGSNPESIAVGDFNGDGHLDLAIANEDSNNVTVLLGDGTGRFTAAPGSPYHTGNSPTSVAVADMNGDGRPDLAISNATDDTITVLLNSFPPQAPSLLGPANGAAGVSQNPTLSWNASGFATSYDVYLGTSSPPPLFTNTTGTAEGVGTLNAGTTYYWRIVAKDSAGSSASAIWSFTTVVVAPPAPVLISPANGVTGVSLTPALSWNASIGATSYYVFFGTSSPPPFVANTTGTSYSPGTLSAGTLYYWQVVAENSAGFGRSAAWSFTTGTATAGLHFIPVTPCRVVDTRNASGPFGGPTMTAGSTRSFTIPQSACSIPNTAQAYSLNVTVVPDGPLGYLSLWPVGQSQPLVSTLNSWGGIVVANAAIVPAGANGAVSVFVTNTTDVILDIDGYFDTSSGATSYSFYPATPCRVADTRNPTGQFGGPSMYAGQTRDFPIPLSSCDVAPAPAYSLNVTVVPDGSLGYLTLWPTGETRPYASTLNSWTGKVVANAALVQSGTNESVSVYASNPTDVILDINGYFGQPGSTGALTFYPVTPCRVADTRNPSGPFGGPEMTAGETRSFTIPSSGCSIPSTAAAYSLNVTVVPDGLLSYLTTWPAGSAQPYVSTLNSFDGSVVANAAIVPAGTNRAISVFVTNPTQVILDIDGYFAP